jgi:hypothetical protein
MEELSKALDIAVTSARMMYSAEYTNLSSAAAAGTAPADSPGSRSQHVGDAVVIELPATATALKAAGAASAAAASTAEDSQQSQPTMLGKQMPAAPAGASANAVAGAGANAAAGAGAGLGGKSPEHLAQMLAGLMMPVQISIARDTWINWKKGALALTPVGWVWNVRRLNPFCVFCCI